MSDFKRNSVKVAFNNNQIQGDVNEMVCDKKRIIESPVKQRVFTNSSVCAKSVNALLAKGNKYKVLHNMKHAATKVLNSRIGQGKNDITSRTMIFKSSVKVHKGNHSQGENSNMGGHTDGNVDTSTQSLSSVVVDETNEHMKIDSSAVLQNGVNKQVTGEQALLYDINGLQEDKFAHTLFFK